MISASPGGASDTETLRPDLCDLALTTRTTAPRAQDVTFVVEPERGRALAQSGRDEPRDLHREVRAEHRDLAGLGIDEPERLAGIRAEPALDGLRELEWWRGDERVAVELEALREAAHEAASRRCLRWQEVARSHGRR